MRNTIRNRVIALGVAVGVLGIALAQAQQSQPGAASGVMALTAMDYIQIKQLVNRYAFARRYRLAQRLRLRRPVRARRRVRQQHARPDQGPRQAGVAGPRREEGTAARQPLHLEPHHRADGHRRDRPAVPDQHQPRRRFPARRRRPSTSGRSWGRSGAASTNRRPVRRRLREDAGRVALPVAQAGPVQVRLRPGARGHAEDDAREARSDRHGSHRRRAA